MRCPSWFPMNCAVYVILPLTLTWVALKLPINQVWLFPPVSEPALLSKQKRKWITMNIKHCWQSKTKPTLFSCRFCPHFHMPQIVLMDSSFKREPVFFYESVFWSCSFVWTETLQSDPQSGGNGLRFKTLLAVNEKRWNSSSVIIAAGVSPVGGALLAVVMSCLTWFMLQHLPVRQQHTPQLVTLRTEE